MSIGDLMFVGNIKGQGIFNVLLVEDDPDYVRMTKKALDSCEGQVHLDVAEDGHEALKFLKNSTNDDSRIRPDVILLDINLPGIDGWEVLKFLKSDAKYKTIPAIILSSSDSDADIRKGYALNANCYVTKPIGIKKCKEFFNSLQDFWFNYVELPD